MSISDEAHLLSISGTRKPTEEAASSDYDDGIEVVSHLETQENELVDIGLHYRTDSSAYTLCSDSEYEDSPVYGSGGASNSVNAFLFLAPPPAPATDDRTVGKEERYTDHSFDVFNVKR